MDEEAPEALFKLIEARERPISPTLPPVAFPNRATARSKPAPPGAAEAPEPGGEAASASAAPAGASRQRGGAGCFGSDADILALLQPRKPTLHDKPEGPFFSAKAFEAHRLFPVASDSSTTEESADCDTTSVATVSEPVRFF